MNNKSTNIEICTKLLEWFSKEENKNQRFMQGLFNLDINEFSDETKKSIIDGNPNTLFNYKDKYNESSETTLNKLNEKYTR
jgi:hypothetical protein